MLDYPEQLEEHESEGSDSSAFLEVIFYYLHMLRRHWVAMLITIVLIVVASSVYTLRMPKVYEATSTLIVKYNSPKPLGRTVEDVTNYTESYWEIEKFYETQLRVINSTPVLTAVVRKLGLDKDLDFLGLLDLPEQKVKEALNETDAVKILSTRIRAIYMKNSQLVLVTAEDTMPERAAQIANAMVEEYIQYNLNGRYTLNREATSWLDQKLLEMQTQLSTSEQNLFAFEKENGILAVSFEDSQEIMSEKVKSLSKELSEVNTQLIALTSRYETMVDHGDLTNFEARLLVEGSQSIQKLQQDVDSFTKDLQVIQTKYGNLHPEYLRAKAQLDSAKAQLEKRINQTIIQLKNELSESNKIKEKLQLELNAARQEALKLNELSIKYQNLKSQVDNYRKLYEMLLKRSKEIELTTMMQFSNAELLEPAEVPLIPVRPRTKLTIFLSFILGMFAAFGVTFIVDQFDRKIKSIEEVERITKAPLLGIIAHIKNEEVQTQSEQESKLSTSAVADANVTRFFYPYFHPKSSVAEDIKLIKANLTLMHPDKDKKFILITSALPREGKSTTASMLGVISASQGKRVLLMDMDLRRPSLHKMLPEGNINGLTNWISGELASIPEITHKTIVADLDLIPCGPVPPDPASILSSDKIRQLLEYAREQYDLIIVDTPPISFFSDTLVLTSMVDEVLFVVHPKNCDRHVLRSSFRQLRNIKRSVLGFILNNIDKENQRYGGYYKYRYYSYSYYHYGSKSYDGYYGAEKPSKHA